MLLTQFFYEFAQNQMFDSISTSSIVHVA